MYRFSASEQGFLKAQRVGRIAQMDGDGLPHVTAMCYASTDSAIYMETTGSSWKVKNLRSRPQISFVADEYFEDWGKLRGIRMVGMAEILTQGGEYQVGKRLLLGKYPDQFRSMGWRDGVQVVVKITPSKATSWGL